MDPRQVIIRPVVSEKSYALMAEGKYTFRIDDRAHKTQVRHAVEEIFDVHVRAVHTRACAPSPSAAACIAGTSRAWKKAVVQLAPGERIELFEGAAVGGLAMAMRKTKPTSPGRRFATYQTRDELTGDGPTKKA